MSIVAVSSANSTTHTVRPPKRKLIIGKPVRPPSRPAQSEQADTLSRSTGLGVARNGSSSIPPPKRNAQDALQSQSNRMPGHSGQMRASDQSANQARNGSIKPASRNAASLNTLSTHPRWRAAAAEDWLAGCIWLDWNEKSSYQNFMDHLVKGQKATHKDGNSGEELIETSCGQIVVKHGSKRLGPDEGHGQYFDYHFIYKGVTIYLTPRLKHHDSRPSAYFVISGEACLRHGALSLWEDLKKFFAALGAKVVRNSISRVDLCCDIVAMSIDPFIQAKYEGRLCTRARNRGDAPDQDARTFEGSSKTLYVGGPTVQMTIYEKRWEVRHGNNKGEAAEEIEQLMLHKRWHGTLPHKAVRVEYKCRSRFLRNHGIRTIEDYLRRRVELLDYLTSKFVRFLKHPPSKGNTSRAPLMDEWAFIRSAWLELLRAEPVPATPIPAYQKQPHDPALNASHVIGVVLRDMRQTGQDLKAMTREDIKRWVCLLIDGITDSGIEKAVNNHWKRAVVRKIIGGKET